MELLLQLSSQRLGCSLSWLIVAFVLFFPTQSLAKCQDLEYPSELFFRGHSFTINDLYVFALNEGNICFKLNSPSAKKWHDLEILQEMKGKIRELSLDGGRLAARGEDDQIFLMRDALEEPKSFNWSGRWGVPFGRGNRSLYLPEDTKLWGFSYLYSSNVLAFLLARALNKRG